MTQTALPPRPVSRPPAPDPTTPDRSVRPDRSRRRSGYRLWWLLLPLVVVLGLVMSLGPSADDQAVLPTGDLVAVERGPLTIMVTSSGSLRSGTAQVIKNRVEGTTSILWIIEEGSRVEEGDLLMELDSSELEDEKLEEEIEVEASRADFVNAQQMLEIARKQGEANIEAARVEYRLALLDLEKYAGISSEHYESLSDPEDLLDTAQEGSILGELNALAGKATEDEANLARFRELLDQIEGSYKQELRKALNAIILADAEMQRAADRYEGTKELHELNFIALTELEADRLDVQRRSLEKEVAADDLALLAKFTYKRTIEELLSAVRQSRFKLERAEHEDKANIVDASANMHAREERLVRDEQNLRQINEQLAASKIYAPRAGMVVYGTTGQGGRDREEPLAEGVGVRERQDLFRLPTTEGMVADIKIHESVLEKVHEGMPVRITTNALPGRSFAGRVQKISVLPDSESQWLNPTLKVYKTTVEVVGEPAGLRPGMSCKAEIVVEKHADTLHLPIQTVVRVDDVPTVFLPGPAGELVPRPVEVGLDDTKMIRILSGVEEGELVSLTPPLAEGEKRGGLEDTEQGELEPPFEEPVPGPGEDGVAEPALGQDDIAEPALGEEGSDEPGPEVSAGDVASPPTQE